MQLPPNCRTETKAGYFVFVCQLITFSSSRKNFSTLLNKLEYCLLLTMYIQTSIYLESCSDIIHTNMKQAFIHFLIDLLTAHLTLFSFRRNALNLM